jgi:hypothetical protein
VQVTAVDLAPVVVGALFVAIGAVAHAIAFSARPRVDRTAAWFGVFCAAYGIRLVADAALLPLITGWPQRFFDGVDSSITYVILGSDEFGDTELPRLLQVLAPGDNMLDTVLEARDRWSGGAPLSDDISIVTVERLS